MRAPWLLLLLVHCDPMPPGTALKDPPCLPDILELERGSSSCREAQGKVNVLLRYSPPCAAIFRDGGFDVCAKLRRDGGRDGGAHD